MMTLSVETDTRAENDLDKINTFQDGFDISFASEFGSQLASGKVKSKADDFVVSELKGFELSGEGQHLCLFVEKKHMNTHDALNVLADFFKVKRKCIGYLGLKDKHAITRQWFSVDLAESPFSELDLEGFDSFFTNCLASDKKKLAGNSVELPEMRIMEFQRNRKKLQIGSLVGNRFEIVVRDLVSCNSCTLDENLQEALEERLVKLKTHGFANYFGEQRFGRDFQNLKTLKSFDALELSRNRALRSRVLSTFRAFVFNVYLSERIRSGLVRKVINGDVLQFSDGRTLFKHEGDAQKVQMRVDCGELVLTGPLVGVDEGMASLDSKRIEKNLLDQWSFYQPLLSRFELKADRRALISFPKNLIWSFSGKNDLCLQFDLPSGSYATSMLRELLRNIDSIR